MRHGEPPSRRFNWGNGRLARCGRLEDSNRFRQPVQKMHKFKLRKRHEGSVPARCPYTIAVASSGKGRVRVVGDQLAGDLRAGLCGPFHALKQADRTLQIDLMLIALCIPFGMVVFHIGGVRLDDDAGFSGRGSIMGI